MTFKIALIAVAAMALAGPAMAIEDTATGFKVEPPAPYTAEIVQRPNYDATIGVRSAPGKPQPTPPLVDLCVIGYKARPEKSELDQAALNEEMRNGNTPTIVTTELGKQAEYVASRTFELGGLVGFEFIGILKNGKADTAIFTSVIDTPLGRTVMNCPQPADGFAAALPELRAIRDGVSPP